jgi:ferredoxin-NADP reductase
VFGEAIGGVGITPLMSVLAAAADTGWRGRIVLLACFRTLHICFADRRHLKPLLPRHWAAKGARV